MSEAIDLSAVRYADLVWLAVDRAFIAGMRAGGSRARELVVAHGGRAVGYLIDLRNPFAAGRTVTRDGLAAVYRYRPETQVAESIAASVAHGLLAEQPAGALTATTAGQTFLRELFALHASVLGERWAAHADRVDRLNQALATMLTAAGPSAGAAWAVQAPPYEPAGTPPEVMLLNRLSTLRYHRADAYAGVWQAAGLTAAQLPELAGPARAEIEHQTNQRAAPPYQVLDPDQRLTLLADLAALP